MGWVGTWIRTGPRDAPKASPDRPQAPGSGAGYVAKRSRARNERARSGHYRSGVGRHAKSGMYTPQRFFRFLDGARSIIVPEQIPSQGRNFKGCRRFGIERIFRFLFRFLFIRVYIFKREKIAKNPKINRF